MHAYDTTKYKTLFIQEAKFSVPYECYMALTEKQRTALYIRTKYVLENLDSMEANTILFKESITEKTANALAQSVIAVAEAMNEHLIKKAPSKTNESETDDSFIQELKSTEEYTEFKAFRFIKNEEIATDKFKAALNEAKGKDESAEMINVISALNTVIEHRVMKESCSYPERGLIFDYIHEMWKHAAKNKGVNESIFHQEPATGLSDNSSRWCSKTMADNKARKAEFVKTQSERMSIYLSHLKK